MRAHFLLLNVIALVCLTSYVVEAKTIFRRTDKFRENYKKLDLPQDEVDPNVAPPVPQKVETIDPEDANGSSIIGTGAPAMIDEIVEEAEEVASTVASIADEVVDEVVDGAVNEVAADGAAVATTIAPVVESTPVKDETSPISKYCKCTETSCDCCRTIGFPLLPLRGPGCAKLTYLGKDKMSVSLKYGDITLASRTISGKRARPICVGLPGGESEFCGRVYGLSKGEKEFKACLGFELRNDEEVEAALRVSCFKFGPKGLRVAEAEPLPSEVNKDEDDDDDLFGFAAGSDDDDYDEDEDDEPDDVDVDDEEEADDVEEAEDDDPEAPEDADYGGFSLAGLLDELDDDEEEKPAVAATPVTAITPTAVDETRTVNERDVAQSKDDKGTELESSVPSATAITAGEEAAAATAQPAATTVKSKKAKRAKKAKKNKKKKAADSESDLAFQILNGILDFFN